MPLENKLHDEVKKREKIEYFLTAVLVVFGILLLTTALFFVLRPYIAKPSEGAVVKGWMAVIIGVVIAFGAYMAMTNRLSPTLIILLLFIVGYVLRMGYVLYTPTAKGQHDTFSKNFNGHEAYAWTIFDTGKLPLKNDYQFYHPPLNALVQAGFMKYIAGLTHNLTNIFGLGSYFPSAFSYGKLSYLDENRWFLYSSCQILSVSYSFITAIMLVKIIGLFNFSDKTKVFLSAFVILYPRHIQFAGMLNNDPLSYMLGVCAMYSALKWQKEGKKLTWILLCGLAVGLGMMAKLSSATICLPIAGIFIYEFIHTLSKREGAMPFSKMAMQYGLFLLICAPIGLWFQVYASIRFDQEFGFVFSNLNKALSTKRHPFFERFFIAFDLKEYFGNLYCVPFSTMNETRTEYLVDGNYNLFSYCLKSSIFGEFTWKNADGLAAAALVFAYLSLGFLIISLIWAIVKCAKTRKENSLFHRAGINPSDLIFVCLLVLSQTLSETYFYIQMPYACTMDFRYILPLILGIALTLGYTQKILAVEGGKFSTAINRLTVLSIGCFLAVSALFYCVAML
jgi:4-amino-4-deoxy-L-arabinose transferase-like glycosyltransferase